MGKPRILKALARGIPESRSREPRATSPQDAPIGTRQTGESRGAPERMNAPHDVTEQDDADDAIVTVLWCDEDDGRHVPRYASQ
jgi:hypothetical protein